MKLHTLKHLAAVGVTLILATGCSILANREINGAYLAQSLGHALTAATLTDAQIIELSRESMQHLDATNKIDSGEYSRRLSRLLGKVKAPEGLTLNYKVYITDEINAFACGDGSIRVYSGLMDVMDDSELMAIIGHEIGHVVHKDTKKMIQRAYASVAAREAIASAGGTAGVLAAGLVGDIASSFVSAQFSQKQEYAADDYGYQFAVDNGFSSYSMGNALGKLVSLSNGSKASYVAQMFSSHPDSEKRAARMKERADSAAGRN